MLECIYTARFYFQVCKDNFLKCPEWARKEECAKNKDWMLKNCQKSCHVCGMLICVLAGTARYRVHYFFCLLSLFSNSTMDADVL